MLKFLIRRLLQGILVVWGVITVMFILRAVSPGDPAVLMAGEGADDEIIQRVREAEGLDEPLLSQYLDYLGSILVGDFGFSWEARSEVTAIVIRRIPATIELAVAATVVALVIAVPLGVISGTRRNEPADYGATLFSLLGISTPNFWLGLMLILVLGVWYGIPYPSIGTSSFSTGSFVVEYPSSIGLGLFDFPTGRREIGFTAAVSAVLFEQSLSELGAWLRHITLPALTLGTYFTALITRLTRSGMIDELGKPYVTSMEAKGLPRILILYKHTLRNTMIPIITVIGLQIGTLAGGAVITETVFNWPGLGLRLIDALNDRDWPVIQGIVIFIAVGFVVINIVVDALYNYLDPQVSES